VYPLDSRCIKCYLFDMRMKPYEGKPSASRSSVIILQLSPCRDNVLHPSVPCHLLRAELGDIER
jgi:hypothetical protein